MKGPPKPDPVKRRPPITRRFYLTEYAVHLVHIYVTTPAIPNYANLLQPPIAGYRGHPSRRFVSLPLIAWAALFELAFLGNLDLVNDTALLTDKGEWRIAAVKSNAAETPYPILTHPAASPIAVMSSENVPKTEYKYKPLKTQEEVVLEGLGGRFASFKIITDPRDYDFDNGIRPSKMTTPSGGRAFETSDCHGSFRLALLRASGDPQAQIKISIQHHEIHCAPAYEAVSYTWGPQANDTLFIALDDGRLKVTKTLEVLLRHLRNKDKDRLLWIDQICIDQTNNAEKGEQVQKMSLIYGRAARSLVWLGEGTEQSRKAFKLVNQIITKTKEMMGSNTSDELEKAFLADRFGLRSWSPEDWDSLKAVFCDHKVWTRIWIVQEMILAKKITFVCGNESTLWVGLAALSTFMATLAKERSNSDIVGNLSAVMRRILCIVDYRTRNEIAEEKHSKPNLGLRYLLNVFQDWEATDPRDMVYALLGLNSGPRITCDYSISLRDLTIQVVKALILHDRNLHTICFFNPHGDNSNVGLTSSEPLPSWVPRLGTWVVENLPWQAWGKPTGSKKGPWDRAPIFQPDNSLICEGRYAGSITRLGELGGIEGGFYEWQKRTWRSLPSDLECVGELGLPQGRESDAIWRTLIQDLDSGGQRLTTEKISTYREEFKDWNRTIASNGSLPYNAPEFVKATLFPTKFMRTAVTSMNCFITVIKEAAVGDIICFLAGAPRPMVLRPEIAVVDVANTDYEASARYRLVGPAYWHGLMDGEVRDKVEFPEQSFTIV